MVRTCSKDLVASGPKMSALQINIFSDSFPNIAFLTSLTLVTCGESSPSHPMTVRSASSIQVLHTFLFGMGNVLYCARNPGNALTQFYAVEDMNLNSHSIPERTTHCKYSLKDIISTDVISAAPNMYN
uniref:Sema domain-containing protein n=1 Tax=Steinernema glaseri TaxID=37863 RepID=A0A1I7YMN6_9BILA